MWTLCSLFLLNVGGDQVHGVDKEDNAGDNAERAEGQSRVDIEGGLKIFRKVVKRSWPIRAL